MPEIHPRLIGVRSGYPYETTSPRGVAQYAVDAFFACCVASGTYSARDIFSVTVDEIIEGFVPGFILEDERYGVLRVPLEVAIRREIDRCCHELCGAGGAGIGLMDYDSGPVDEILLEKALDFMVDLETAERIRSASAYQAVHDLNAPAIHQCMRIIRAYGEQREPLTLAHLQCAFGEITGSGKYARNPVVSSVAKSMISQAWEGVGGWES